MHGRKKVARTEEYLRLQQAKVQKYCALKSELIRLKREKRFSEETLVILGKLLYIAPDFTTLWNLRREILLELEKTRPLEEDDLQKEMKLTSLILLDRDYKSYGTWAHRAWIVEKHYLANVDVLKNELVVSAKVLAMDLRNFHAWNYRKRILRFLEDAGEEEEVAKEGEFLHTLFSRDPSNYSAWQNLSKVVEFDQLEAEFKKCVNMFYVDPEDSSAWIFHRWLFLKDLESEPPAEGETSEEESVARLTDRLAESEYCMELLDVCDEDESKWPLITIVQNSMMWLDDPRLVLRKDFALRGEYMERKLESLLGHLEILCRIDPDRLGYYRDMRSDFVLKSRFPDLSVTSLTLHGGQLTRMNSLTFFPELRVVDLSENGIVEIPSVVGRSCPNLETLILAKNRVIALRPSELETYRALRVLDLRHNLIRFVDESACFSQTIEVVWFEGNGVFERRSQRADVWKVNFPKVTSGDVVVEKSE